MIAHSRYILKGLGILDWHPVPAFEEHVSPNWLSLPLALQYRGNSHGRLPSCSGLYYYGARYYDPLIGRFISADTLVQSPANPQTLNRYSYVLNNPLRYTDPTGHYVVFSGGFSYRSGRNRQRLEQAWNMLKWAAIDMPKLAEMIQNAEESESMVKIGWSPLPEGTGSIVLGDERLGKQSMWIDSSLRDEDIMIVAETMAHELYHVNEGRQVVSIEEEMEAYSFEYDVGRRLCLPVKNIGTTAKLMHGLDPLSESDVESATGILRGVGSLYPYFPQYPLDIDDTDEEWWEFMWYMTGEYIDQFVPW